MVTLLEDLCAHVLSFGANAFETERDGSTHQAFALIDGAKTRVANFSSAMAREFQKDLQKALKKPIRSVIVGTVYEIRVEAIDDRRCQVSIVAAPKLDPRIKTLERNGFIERTPRVAQSIRLLVESKYLPELP